MGSRGAISLDGGLFLWACRDAGYRKWRGKVLDFGRRSVIWECEEVRHFEWDVFWEEMMSSEAFSGKKETPWIFGAVFRNRSVVLRDVDPGQQSADEWRFFSGDERGALLPRVNCALRSADGGKIHAASSLTFDNDIRSIASGTILREAEARRCAVVACQLRGRSIPAIMHFYTAKN